MSTRVLVTGAAGFIGSHVVDALIDAGREVIGLDLLHDAAHAGRPDYLNPAAEWAIGDVRDPELVQRCLRGVDAVCHQAAMVGLGLDLEDITEYVAHNDAGTATLLRALARGDFAGRLVLASSMVVYGEGRYRCALHGLVSPLPRRAEALDAGRFEPCCPQCDGELEAEPVPEDAPTDPRNVYAATKLHQEHLCAALAREREVALTVLRYHNVYGPRMPRETPYAGVASIFRSALASGEAPRVLEDGRQRRDFVHVRDVARANVLAMCAHEPVAGTFNVASGTARTVGDLAVALSAAAAPAAPAPEVTGGYRLGDVRHVFAATDRARDHLGFTAQVLFAEGMHEFAHARLREPARHQAPA